ncbi:hypothetical protein FLONG3_1338 [Fusarium longipes]|uniref:Uncharacterized protein n=1 Tax=Fusarium longipes TaxID=694270 RepID=A0A395T6Y1_9HYPO|nr:hypothetical protein FLONG3_1338 [Fusarium longipes]
MQNCRVPPNRIHLHLRLYVELVEEAKLGPQIFTSPSPSVELGASSPYEESAVTTSVVSPGISDSACQFGVKYGSGGQEFGGYSEMPPNYSVTQVSPYQPPLARAQPHVPTSKVKSNHTRPLPLSCHAPESSTSPGADGHTRLSVNLSFFKPTLAGDWAIRYYSTRHGDIFITVIFITASIVPEHRQLSTASLSATVPRCSLQRPSSQLCPPDDSKLGTS